MSALSRATQCLSSTLKRVAGEAVVYSRGLSLSVPLTAVHDMQSYEVVNDQGFPETVIAHDFLIAASDLVSSDLPVLPRNGDQVSLTISGAACVFEAMPLGNRPCFEAADPDGVMLVVHTKKVG